MDKSYFFKTHLACQEFNEYFLTHIVNKIFLWVLCLRACLYHTVPDATRGQKRMPDPLGLELQAVVNLNEGAGNWSWVLSKSD